MHTPKPISAGGIPGALEKAERYRLLNEPSAAESICMDVLAVEPDNQQATIMLLLAITDQFAEGAAEGERRAHELLPRIRDEYKRAYYEGVVCERRGRAAIRSGRGGWGELAYEWLTRAMQAYERAERIRPSGNDEAILRWNTCARMIDNRLRVEPGEREAYEPSFD
ncbi:MAG: hypothetical protein M3Y31_03965 [Gemmatimonadota bacterium]|nr:hypothetical protein [Gemmatimonadota bacterium]